MRHAPTPKDYERMTDQLRAMAWNVALAEKAALEDRLLRLADARAAEEERDAAWAVRVQAGAERIRLDALTRYGDADGDRLDRRLILRADAAHKPREQVAA